MIKNYVAFKYPDSLSDPYPIENWDTAKAIEIAKKHFRDSVGFKFYSHEIEVNQYIPKLDSSGIYYFKGILKSFEDIEDENNTVLLNTMEQKDVSLIIDIGGLIFPYHSDEDTILNVEIKDE